MKELHTREEWHKIYLNRISRYLFWANVARFFRLKKLSRELADMAREHRKLIEIVTIK